VDISNYIKDLLCRYNAVIVPNFGAFEWCYFPANLEAIEQKIQPPSYQLYFNAENNQDAQHLLVDYIAEKESLAKELAQEALVAYRLQLEDTLLKQKKTPLEGLGTLQLTGKGQINLMIDEADVRAVSPASGLPILDCVPILRDKSYLENAAKAKLSESSRKRKKVIVFWSILIVLLLGLSIAAIVFWPILFSKNANKNNTVALGDENDLSIIPLLIEPKEDIIALIAAYRQLPFIPPAIASAVIEEESNITPTVSETELATPTEEISEPVANTEITETSNTIVEEVNNTITNTTVVATEMSSDEHLIVIGVFSDEQNVNRNTRLLEEAGYRAELKKLQTGHTRIAAIVKADSKDVLYQQWQKIRSTFTENAWIVPR